MNRDRGETLGLIESTRTRRAGEHPDPDRDVDARERERALVEGFKRLEVVITRSSRGQHAIGKFRKLLDDTGKVLP